MKQFFSRILNNEHIKKHSFLPAVVKSSEFGDVKLYNPNDWEVVITNTGPQVPISYNHLYCRHCNFQLLPPLHEKHGKADLVSLISDWDNLELPDSLVEYVGCFIPWNKKQCAGPSAKHFIHDPAEHAKHTHPYTVSVISSEKKRKQAALQPLPSKVVVIDIDTGTSSTQISSSQKVFKPTEKAKNSIVSLPMLPMLE